MHVDASSDATASGKGVIALANAVGNHFRSLLPTDMGYAWNESPSATQTVPSCEPATTKLPDECPVALVTSEYTASTTPIKAALITSTPNKQTPFTPINHVTPNIKSIPLHLQELDTTKIIARVRRRCEENLYDLNLLVRENRRLRAQKRSLSCKLDMERKKVPKVNGIVMDLDASLDASIFEEADVDALLSALDA